MDAGWISSPSARRILVHFADPRPAWLWSSDGSRLIWRNGAARFFAGKLKKWGVKLVPEAVPIKGQVARLVRLGSTGRSSLARIQFLAGGKPVSATATVTPLVLWDAQGALLIVGVDAIAADLLEAAVQPDPPTESLFPRGSDYLLIDDDGLVAGGSPRGRDEIASALSENGQLEQAVAGARETVDFGDGTLAVTRLTASPRDASLLVFAMPDGAAQDAAAPEPVAAEVEEPLLPMGLPAVEAVEPEVIEEPAEEEVAPPRSLSSLFDRLAGDERLYAGLEPSRGVEGGAEPIPNSLIERDDIAAIIAYDETYPPDETTSYDTAAAETAELAEASEEPAEADDEPAVLYQLTGRGFEPMAGSGAAPPEAAVEEPADVASLDAVPPPASEAEVERVSRYNFDELSRILNDRVGAEPPAGARDVATEAPVGRPSGQLVSLAGETFILNRLPLGILVFRDQQVLFANRSITEMMGYGSIEELRQAGLAAIFPGESVDDTPSAGPVNHLLQRDGTLVPVTARLQSISWQGRPALMLSASTTEVRTGHEAAVRAFAELIAATRNDGFIEFTRQGVVQTVSARATTILGRTEESLVGKPLSALIAPDQIDPLRAFLERPARFAETARPTVILTGTEPGVEMTVFAQGQAGVVSGYFAVVRRRDGTLAIPAPTGSPDIEPSLLARISRGIRGPLNTIVGFADLIGSAEAGAALGNRHEEYARDIKSAGFEIATLIDELDDYARLKDGRYAARPAELDLGLLLESCIVRVRGQAGAARVLVRSSVSEHLPRVRADRPSLAQAILNLLSSAIAQTPAGGSVILSAQSDSDGSISVNVRDTGKPPTDVAERFVVFRDGTGKDGEPLVPVRSSVGLALTRSLLAVNAFTLSIDPAGGSGTLFSVSVPASAVEGNRLTAAD